MRAWPSEAWWRRQRDAIDRRVLARFRAQVGAQDEEHAAQPARDLDRLVAAQLRGYEVMQTDILREGWHRPGGDDAFPRSWTTRSEHGGLAFWVDFGDGG